MQIMGLYFWHRERLHILSLHIFEVHMTNHIVLLKKFVTNVDNTTPTWFREKIQVKQNPKSKSKIKKSVSEQVLA